MSDFFTRLAERTLGLELIIQPIKPSLFAPEPDTGAEMPFEMMEKGVAAQTFGEARFSVPSQPDTDTPALRPNFVPYAETSAAQFESPQAGSAHPAAISARASDSEASAMSAKRSQPGMRTASSSFLYSEASAMPPEHSRPESPRPVPARPSTSYTPARVSVNGTLSQAQLRQSPEKNHRHAPTLESFSPHSPNLPELRPVTNTIELAAQQSGLNAEYAGSHDESLLAQNAASEPNSNISAMNTELAAIPATQAPVVGSGRVGLYGRQLEGMAKSATSGVALPDTHSYTPVSLLQAQLEEPKPEPAIQVTIGRVEVRAVTAPPATARSQPQPVRPPAMSLDEYLSRQEQGGRR
jgi:hypothetical protein